MTSRRSRIAGRLARTWQLIDVRDWTFLAGLALLSSGAALVYEPAGLIVPGAILVWQAIGGSRRASS